MKTYGLKLVLVCSMLITNYWVWGQSISLQNVSLHSTMTEYRGNLIVSGAKLTAGRYGSNSLIYFINENLEPVWSYKLDEYHSNLIGEISVFDDKIFVTGMEGHVSDTYKDTRRFLLVLDLKGNLIKKERLGICQYLQSTPLVKIGSELMMYYNTDTTVMRNPVGEYFSLNLTTVSLDNYTIKDGPITFNQKLRTGSPSDVLHIDDQIYLLGNTDIGLDTYCFLKAEDEDSTEPMKLINADLLTLYNLRVGSSNQTKLLFNVNDYNGWKGYLVRPRNLMNSDSLSTANPNIVFKERPNDIFSHGDQIFFLETIEHYRKYGFVVTDLTGEVLKREILDFIPEKIVVNENYYYFLETFSGAKIIRKPRRN